MQTPSPADTSHPSADPALVALAQAASPALEGENSKPNQPFAGVDSAQSAIKDVAQFTHIYRAPLTPFNAPHLRRFCEPSLNSIGLGVVAPVGYAAAIVELQIHDGSTIVNVSMQLDADNLEMAACHFLDAAHHLRQQAAKGGAA